jgi:hypothetical protein
MAVKGTYNFRGMQVPDVYLKVTQITGNEAGWTAQVGAFANSTTVDPLETFVKAVGYRAGIDPFIDLEDKLLQDFAGFVRVSPKRITRLEFMQRFTGDERIRVRTAAQQSQQIADYMDLVALATFIDITRQDTIAGVQALEALGLIAAGRAAQILDPDQTDGVTPAPAPAPV